MRTVLLATAAAWVLTAPPARQAGAPAVHVAFVEAPGKAFSAGAPGKGTAAAELAVWFAAGAAAAALARPLALAAADGRSTARSPAGAAPVESVGRFPARLPRRTAIGSAALGLMAIAAAPGPAAARSKEKAKEKAIQKATASEARQAMKEYKFAPRPELVGDASTGYSFKEGTVKAGSTGELAGYFKDKGADIQAEYKAEKARATGATAADARRIAEEQKKKAAEAAAAKKKRELTSDELKIKEMNERRKGERDDMGRLIGI